MKGFLFIGDPHVTSVRPGRRKDDFLASVLGKLTVAVEIARREDLMPVILGDLFHRAGEDDWRTISRLTRVLQQFHVVPLCLGGNHDKEETQLTEVDALQYLDQVGVLRVFDGPCREAMTIETSAGRMALWAAPYGARLPQSIESDADQVVLITHHDLAFQGAYPGSAELYEIPGCDLVVNGHMHKTAPSVLKGKTHWHCPGNIEPLSIDCIDHVPAVWAWCGGDSTRQLQRIVLPHERDCFDLTGTVVAAATTRAALEALGDAIAPAPVPVIPASSEFAELLSAQSTMEAVRTQDSQTFLEDMQQAFGEMGTATAVNELLLSLAKRVNVTELPALTEVSDVA